MNKLLLASLQELNSLIEQIKSNSNKLDIIKIYKIIKTISKFLRDLSDIFK